MPKSCPICSVENNSPRSLCFMDMYASPLPGISLALIYCVLCSVCYPFIVYFALFSESIRILVKLLNCKYHLLPHSLLLGVGNIFAEHVLHISISSMQECEQFDKLLWEQSANKIISFSQLEPGLSVEHITIFRSTLLLPI